MKQGILAFYGHLELDFLAFEVFLPRGGERAHTNHTLLSLIGFQRLANFDDLFEEFMKSKKMKARKVTEEDAIAPEEVEALKRTGYFAFEYPGLRTASG